MTAPVSFHYADSLAGDFLSQCCLFAFFSCLGYARKSPSLFVTDMRCFVQWERAKINQEVLLINITRLEWSKYKRTVTYIQDIFSSGCSLGFTSFSWTNCLFLYTLASHRGYVSTTPAQGNHPISGRRRTRVIYVLPQESEWENYRQGLMTERRNVQRTWKTSTLHPFS